MSWDGIYTALFTLLSDANTGLNSFLSTRGLDAIQAWMREELTRDVAPAGVITYQGASLSPLASVHSAYFADTFSFLIYLRESTPNMRGRETKARKYLDAVKDFLAGKRVAGCPIHITEASIEYPDPTHTVIRVGLQIHHPGGEI